MKLTRRNTLLAGLAGGVSGCATPASESSNTIAQFNHGVASGDPSADGFVIWTRVTPSAGEALSVAWDVIWDVAEDAAFKTIVQSGTARARRASDWTVKEEVANLKSGGTYFYRFRIGAVLSPTGRSKTLPEAGVTSLNFAVVSCSNFPN